MSGSEGKEFMMPTPAEGAAFRFFIEEVKGLREDFRQERAERKEERSLLSDVHTRVVRIEEQAIAARLEGLGARVRVLEEAHLEARGVHSVGNWFAKNGVNVVALITGLIAIIYMMLRASGRVT